VADGVVITPSHNPPEDGGFKYNPPEEGRRPRRQQGRLKPRQPADCARSEGVKRIPFEKVFKKASTHEYDYVTPYVEDLAQVIDIGVIAREGLKIGADPLGGTAVDVLGLIAERYGLRIDVVNPVIDPTFSFMTVDHDGRIRMDCSSPYAMAGLIRLKDKYDISFGNDTDADRHGIVAKSTGLLNPNHYLSVAVGYLFQNRPGWRREAAVGKTLVSTSMIDRVAASLGGGWLRCR